MTKSIAMILAAINYKQNYFSNNTDKNIFQFNSNYYFHTSIWDLLVNLLKLVGQYSIQIWIRCIINLMYLSIICSNINLTAVRGLKCFQMKIEVNYWFYVLVTTSLQKNLIYFSIPTAEPNVTISIPFIHEDRSLTCVLTR